MKKILIVLNNKKLMSVFEKWLTESGDKSLLLLATSAEQAIKMLIKHPVAIIVTELMMLETTSDGFDFLSYLVSQHSEARLCTILNMDVFQSRILIKNINSIGLFKKPKRLIDVVQMLTILADNNFQPGKVGEVSLAEILKLIEIEKKSCALEVIHTRTHTEATVYFYHGILYDAFCNEMEGEDAVLEILDWQQFEFKIKSLPADVPYQNIQHSLNNLIIKQKHFTAR